MPDPEITGPLAEYVLSTCHPRWYTPGYDLLCVRSGTGNTGLPLSPKPGMTSIYPGCSIRYDTGWRITCSGSGDRFISTAVCVPYGSPATLPHPIHFP